jgi:hypothetical protein
VAALAGIALTVRLPLIFSRHEIEPGDQAEFYFLAASSISSGDGFPSEFWTPGYAALIALLDLLPGREEDAVIVVQHLLGAGLAVAVFFAARRWFGLLTAAPAAVLVALSPGLLIQEQTPLPDYVFGVFIFAGALLLAEACARGGDATRLLIAAGVMFGVAAWLKPAGEFLFVAAPAALLFATRAWRPALRGSAIVAGVMLVTISPWLVRNAVWHDHAGMSNQSGATLFNRAFEVSTLPIPPGEEHGALARRVRAEVSRMPRDDPNARFHAIFHRALIDEAGLGDQEAWDEQRAMALHAIWTYPKAYTTDNPRLVADSFEDITEFYGHLQLEDELAAGVVPERMASGYVAGVRALVKGWWILCLHGLAVLLVLVSGDRRRRAAAVALISVWLAMTLGTVLSHGGLWRYSMQLAPLTLMLVSAGGAILVASVRDFLRREGSPA